MKALRRLVFLAALGLFAVWLTSSFQRLAGQDSEWAIRLTLGGVFALLLMLRRKDRSPDEREAPGGRLAVMAIAGTALAVTGIVMPVRQMEWLGVVLLLYGALRWSLPPFFSRDLCLAMFVLYWIHPLPSVLVSQLEFRLQMLSVQGGEWLLHAANQPVWADGSALYTGLRVFDVDRSCSGLRTASTVLLCVLGSGLLRRMRWWELVTFGLVGVGQVVFLNMIRIFVLIWLAPRMPAAWSDTFLHDTLGWFLLVGIIMVQVEMSWWNVESDRRRRLADGIRDGVVERPDKGSFFPLFWTMVFRWARVILAVALVGAVVTLVVYKSRPAHRAEMVRNVVDGLLQTNLTAAEKAMADVERMIGSDRLLTVKRIHILVRQRRFQEALQSLGRIPGEPTTFEKVLRSCALMGLDRADEAMQVIAELPTDKRESPSIALFQAEYAVRKDLPAVVARNAVLASKSHTTIPQVRAMFPYLASREQWSCIADCRSPVPFSDLMTALISIRAGLRVGQLHDAAELLREAMKRWPGEPRLLGDIYEMAARGAGEEWETEFDQGLQAALPRLDADRLASYVGYGFRLNRPDLAWMAYRRLAELDPSDPALSLAVAQFAPVWFTFRKHHLGIEAGDKRDLVDLRAEFARKKITDEWLFVRWGTIPMSSELLTNRLDRVRARHVDQCLVELRQRKQVGQMTRRLDMSFPVALGMAEQYDEAHQWLTDLQKKYPDERSDLRMQMAMLYDRRGQWQESYEILRTLDIRSSGLMFPLLMANALMNMDQGLAAIQVIERARREFPGVAMASVGAAAVWDVFGFKEEALFALRRGCAEWKTPAYVQLLYDSGRYGEARKLSQTLGIRILERAEKGREGLVLPAEAVLMRRWPKPLSAENMAREAAALESRMAGATSPFIRELLELEAEWHRTGGGGAVSDPARWQAVGRDNRERASALHRLAFLLGCQGRYGAASLVIQKALEFVPDSVVLWRIAVALSEGDTGVVDRAMEACPGDGDIWLASLVTRVRAAGPTTGNAIVDWADQEVQAAVVAKRFAPGTMVRAADFLLRSGLNAAATAASRDAIERGQGLLSSYAVGLRCAMAAKDLHWARVCALGGLDNSLDPLPFQVMIATLGFVENTLDSDLVAALEFLRKRFPQESEWPERLGFVYFQKGDPARALTVLGPLLRPDAGGVRPESFILAAESARIEGKVDVAIRILDAANAMYPKTLSVLNNLVYTLAQRPATLGRALSLLPDLLKLDSDSFVVRDTVATVCFRSGKLDEAESHILRALQAVDDKNYAALEVRMNAAEIFLAKGRVDVARNMIELILKNPKCPKPVEQRGRELKKLVAQAPLKEDLANATRLYQARKYEEALAIVKRILLDPVCDGDVEKGATSLLHRLVDDRGRKR